MISQNDHGVKSTPNRRGALTAGGAAVFAATGLWLSRRPPHDNPTPVEARGPDGLPPLGTMLTPDEVALLRAYRGEGERGVMDWLTRGLGIEAPRRPAGPVDASNVRRASRGLGLLARA
ncbi:MAG: hypothetical protein KC583_19225 [Myxococcales bacterium]|nr:hypothetical protein [Myxococcales bacterium]